ncbi:MAG: transcriptional regulator, partial [Actinomycetes bacterium]
MEQDQTLDLVALLGDPVRRSLYQLCRNEVDALTRDDAAGSVGISRKLAAFHLDKMVEAGLLVADFRSRPHRLGRPVKVYAPSAMELQISIPERRYQALAELLVDAGQSSPERREETMGLARHRGEQAGQAVRS